METEVEMENESLTCPTNLECGVCLEILDQTDTHTHVHAHTHTHTHDNTGIISKWKCNHYFHKECVANWHHSCPLCRNRECRTEFGGVILNTPHTPSVGSYENDFQGGEENDVMIHPQHRVHPEQYLQQWPYQSCIRNGHSIHFMKPNGVLGICRQCEIIKMYNYIPGTAVVETHAVLDQEDQERGITIDA